MAAISLILINHRDRVLYRPFLTTTRGGIFWFFFIFERLGLGFSCHAHTKTSKIDQNTGSDRAEKKFEISLGSIVIVLPLAQYQGELILQGNSLKLILNFRFSKNQN